MRIVYHAESIVDAHLVKDALEQAEIPAFVNGEYLIGGMGQLPARDFLSVSVPDVCIEKAEPVVREITAMLAAPLADPEPEPEAGTKPARPVWHLKPAPI